MKILCLLALCTSAHCAELFSPFPTTEIHWTAPSNLVEVAQECLDIWNVAVDGRFTFIYDTDAQATTNIVILNNGISFNDTRDVNGQRIIRMVPMLDGSPVMLISTRKVLLHECGHAFGLAHTDPANCYGYYLPFDDPPIMNTSLQNYVCTLHTDDIYRIRNLYGLAGTVDLHLKLPCKAWQVRQHGHPVFRWTAFKTNKHVTVTSRGRF